MSSRANFQSIRQHVDRFLTSNPHLAFHANHVFETGEKLGEGGMGQVYRVFDKRTQRYAALKMLHKSDERSTRRFMREARITARLDHPNIPPVYEVGQTLEGHFYLLMRLIRGQTLKELLLECEENRSLRTQRRELLQIYLKVLEALAYAHSHRIVHRDLKPENIMVGEFGEVLVIDWGIAKDLNRAAESRDESVLDPTLSQSEMGKLGLTVAGHIVGTPGYMAPEQLEANNSNPASDVFSLGLILFEILTGTAAVSGDTKMEIVGQTLSGNLPDPSKIDNSVSKDLAWIFQQATKLDIEQRTASVELLIQQVNDHLSDKPITGYSYSFLNRTLRLIRSHPAVVVSTFSILLSLAVVTNIWFVLSIERERLKHTTSMNELKLANETRKREKIEKQAQQLSSELKVKDDDLKRDQQRKDLLEQAKSILRRGGAQQQVKEKIDAALKLKPSKQDLEQAAELFEKAKLYKDSRQQWEAIVSAYPPGFNALFRLHLLDLKANNLQLRAAVITKPLKRLAEAAKARNIENEFTLVLEAVKASKAKRWDVAITLLDRAESYNKTLPYIFRMRGNAKKSLGDLAAAEIDLNQSIELDPNDVGSFIDRSTVYISQSRYRRAIADCNVAITLFPNDFHAYVNRGVCFSRMKNYEQAETNFKKAVQLSPHNPEVYCYRGDMYFQQKRYKLAKQQFNQALEASPKFIKAYYKLGELHLKTREYSNALFNYNAILNQEPESVRALNNRAIVYLKTKRVTLARLDLNQVLKLEPEHNTATKNLALSYAIEKDFETAVKKYQEAIERLPNDSELHQSLGFVFHTLKRYEECLEQFAMCLKINPRQPAVLVDRAKIYRKLKQLDKAEQELLKAFKFAPNNYLVNTELGNLYFKSGRFHLSLSSFQRSLKVKPNDIRSLIFISLSQFQQQQFSRALKNFTRLIELGHDKFAGIYQKRGACYSAIGQFDLALKEFERGLEVEAAAIEVNYSRAYCYSKYGKFAEAAKVVEEVLKKHPNDTAAISQRAVIKLFQGKTDEAIRIFKEAAATSPKAAQPIHNISLCYLEAKNYDEALKYSNQAIALDNRVGDHFIAKAQILLAQNKLELAETAVREARELIPDCYELEVWRGRLFVKLERFAEAEKIFSRAIELEPTAQCYLARGEFYEQQKQNDKALKDLKTALEITKKIPTVQNLKHRKVIEKLLKKLQ